MPTGIPSEILLSTYCQNYSLEISIEMPSEIIAGTLLEILSRILQIKDAFWFLLIFLWEYNLKLLWNILRRYPGSVSSHPFRNTLTKCKKKSYMYYSSIYFRISTWDTFVHLIELSFQLMCNLTCFEEFLRFLKQKCFQKLFRYMRWDRHTECTLLWCDTPVVTSKED